MNKKIKIIDLFSGAGGLSFGFARDKNFKIIAANEISPKMAKSYELNHPEVKIYCKDIKDFGIKDLKRDFILEDRKIDVVIGGPPCQSFSTIGKRLSEDPRSKLFEEYYRILKELKPKIFVFENVAGLLSYDSGQLFKKIIKSFKLLGFEVSYEILNSADYGVPQIRKRIFIVGSKLKNTFFFPKKTHKKYITLAEAIGDLPFIGSGKTGTKYQKSPQNIFQEKMRENATNKITDHNAILNNEKLINLMMRLPDGGTPIDLPIELRPKSGFKNTYSKLWWNLPSPTITRNFSTASSSRCIHPIASRPLTTREGARLQSFPDNYIFFGSRTDKNLQIGNAVPPLISIAIKNSVLNLFLKD